MSTGTAQRLDPLLRPRSVAFVGACARAGSRLFVDRPIHDAFVEKFIAGSRSG